MAKDPAMLWYWNDWYSATVLYSRFLKGCYMDLLHAQFNNGRLSLEEIKICLGADFGSSWPTLQKKFKQDEKGLFFNERLEREKEKRKAFTESRKKNLHMDKHMNNHMAQHMGPHMENRNENKDDDEVKDKGGEGEKGKFKIDPKMEIPPNLLELAEMNQWTLTNERNTEFIKKQWKTFLHERAHDPPGKKMQYHRLSDITSYFLNWIRNKHPNNGSHKQTSSGSNKKSGISSDRIEALKNF